MTRAVTLAATLFALAPGLALAQAAAAQTPQGGGTPAMRAAMERMQRDMAAMPMTGDADRDWAMMMRRHHEAAIEMSRAHHGAGRDREIERMAQKAIEDQTRDIRQIDEWMRAHPAR
jgi:uncharacterized protein (DUF305 family)